MWYEMPLTIYQGPKRFRGAFILHSGTLGFRTPRKMSIIVPTPLKLLTIAYLVLETWTSFGKSLSPFGNLVLFCLHVQLNRGVGI